MDGSRQGAPSMNMCRKKCTGLTGDLCRRAGRGVAPHLSVVAGPAFFSVDGSPRVAGSCLPSSMLGSLWVQIIWTVLEGRVGSPWGWARAVPVPTRPLGGLRGRFHSVSHPVVLHRRAIHRTPTPSGKS